MKGSNYIEEYKKKSLPDAENLKRCQEMRAIFLAMEWAGMQPVNDKMITHARRLLRLARQVIQSQSKGVLR